MNPQSSTRRAALLLSTMVAAAVVAAFSPLFGADWVQWDDDRNFTEHLAWRGLSSEHLRWMFSTTHMGHYQPLAWLTLALDWSVWGLDARGFHATNIVLHALTAVALFALARRLLAVATGLGAEEPELLSAASVAALLFAVHPLRVESVAWITERRDVLGGVFFVLAVHAWVGFRTAHASVRARWYVWAVLCALLSLLSKAAAMVLPAVFLVVDVWPLRRLREQRGRELLAYLPFVLLTGVFAWVALGAQASTRTALTSLDEHTWVERLVQAGYGAAFYLGKSLWPSALIPIRELPKDLLAPEFVAPAAFALLLTIVLVAFAKRAPALLAAWIAYLAILSPVSGIAQAGPQLVADRYSYFACMPLALLAGGAPLRFRARRALIWGALAAPLVLLSVATLKQARAWVNTEALWTHTLQHDPANGVALHNLGSHLLVKSASVAEREQRRALVEQARELFELGLERAPAPKFHVGLGLVAGQLADLEPAERAALKRQALESIERGVREGEAEGFVDIAWRFQLGAALLDAGRVDDAVQQLELVAREWTENPQVRRVLSLAYAAQERWPEALLHGEAALRMQPDDALLTLRVALFHFKLDHQAEARAALERVLELRAGAPADDLVTQQARDLLSQIPQSR
jgi:tetratricopeptide (TPR) repeat protein